MSTSPAVSVVVPIGRASDDVAVQLRALHEQDHEGTVEFVLTLNTDDPAQQRALEALVEPLADPRFRIVVEGVRRGAAAARNAGAAAAVGDTLAFCDADDIVDRSWLRLLLAGLETCDAVGGRLVDFGPSERQLQARPATTPDALPTCLGAPYIVSASLALPHSTFDDAGGFDEGFPGAAGEDIAFSWVLIDKGKTLGYAPDAIVQYRHRTGVPDMMRQHFRYGRGMSHLLVHYDVPGAGGSKRSLLTPTGLKAEKRTALGTLRRASTAAGRLTGVVEELLLPRGAAMVAEVRAPSSKERVYELLNPTPVRDLSGDLSGRLLRRFATTMPVTDAPALVVAPHQDDETLGCGGLIALKRRRSVPVHVAFTTDGSGGEPTSAPPEVVVAARHAEALAALAVLDVADERVHFLSGEDGRLRESDAAERAALERELDAVLDASAPAEVFVTYQYDNHPDHRATFELVAAAVDRAATRHGRTIALYQYPIWGFWQNPVFHRFRHRRVKGFVRVDVSSVLDRKALALDPYDGQLSGLPKLIRRQALWAYELYLPVAAPPPT